MSPYRKTDYLQTAWDLAVVCAAICVLILITGCATKPAPLDVNVINPNRIIVDPRDIS